MNCGKQLRMRNIFRKDGRTLIVAMDHAAIAGAMGVLQDPAKIIEKIASGGADAILTTRGMLKKGYPAIRRGMGIIMRISGGFTLLTEPVRFYDRIISSVETALRWGADAVGITIKYGHPSEGIFIEQASKVADICNEWGIPLMIEVMAQGERVEKLGFNIASSIACRAAFEIGADFVKVSYPGQKEEFQQMVKECPAPLIILGGKKIDSQEQLLKMVKESIEAGGKGIAIGRNIWGNPNPTQITEVLKSNIHSNNLDKSLNPETTR